MGGSILPRKNTGEEIPMKKILVLLLLPLALTAQDNIIPSNLVVLQQHVSCNLVDSILFRIPKFAVVEKIYVHSDSASNDSTKIYAQGCMLSPMFFGVASMSGDSTFAIKATQTATEVRGELATDDASLVVETGTADVYVQMQQLWKAISSVTGKSIVNMDTSVLGGVLRVRKHQGGWYHVIMSAGFSSSKNATAHFAVYRNGVKTRVSMERTITSAGSIGSATTLGALYLNDGDSLSIHWASSAINTTFTVNHFAIVAWKLPSSPETDPYVAGKQDVNIVVYDKSTSGSYDVSVMYRKTTW
jgi:hypothetical protein